MNARFVFQLVARQRVQVLSRPTIQSQRLAPISQIRFATTTKGDAPNASQSIAKDNPQSASAESQGVNESRATDGNRQDSASVAEPHSQGSSGGGQDEEGGDPVKKDPSKPAEQKRKETEAQGQTPLDPADK